MTYYEAKALVEDRRRQEEEHWVLSGSPSISDPEAYGQYVKDMPTHIYNAHSILYSGMRANELSDGRVFLSPPGLMVASFIPPEAFVSSEQLAENEWSVSSIKTDFDW